MSEIMVPPHLLRLDSEINVLQIGGRLEITASVDLAGLRKLRLVLEKYGEILNMMDTSTKMMASDLAEPRLESAAGSVPGEGGE